MTANAFMSVSLRPPLIVISVDRRAKMHALLNEGRRYGSVCSPASSARSPTGSRAGRLTVPKRSSSSWFAGRRFVRGALARLVRRVAYWGGDHSLFVGQVEYARYGEGQPLLFHGGRYEHLLGRSPVFSSLPPAILEITAQGEERTFEAGDPVVRAGDPGDELFVILEGSADVMRGGTKLATFGVGEFFGEIAVLDGRPRSADVTATSALRVLAISRDFLQAAMEHEPRAAWAMLEVLAGRLRDD